MLSSYEKNTLMIISMGVADGMLAYTEAENHNHWCSEFNYGKCQQLYVATTGWYADDVVRG